MRPLSGALFCCVALIGVRLGAENQAPSAQEFEKKLKQEVEGVIQEARVHELWTEFKEQVQAAKKADPEKFNQEEWQKEYRILEEMSDFSVKFETAKQQLNAGPPQDKESALDLQDKLDDVKLALSGLCKKLQIADFAAVKEKYRQALGVAAPPPMTPEQAAKSQQQKEHLDRVGSNVAKSGAQAADIKNLAGSNAGGANSEFDKLYHGAGDAPPGAADPGSDAVKLDYKPGAAGKNPSAQDFGFPKSLHTGPIPGGSDQIDVKYPYDRQLRGAITDEMAKNPVTKELIMPVLKEGKVKIAVRGEKEGMSPDAWGVFHAREKEFVLNRDNINQDIAELNRKGGKGWKAVEPIVPDKPLTGEQKQFIAQRYKPMIAHELTHALHDRDVEKILGPGHHVNVKDTERLAFQVEAMTIAAERRRDPGYLKEDASFSRDETKLADVYEQAKKRGDPKQSFSDYVDRLGYKGITVADKNGPELRQLGALSDKVQGDCKADMRSQRCSEGLDTVQNVLSVEGQRSLRHERVKLLDQPDCEDCQRNVLVWVDVAKVRLGDMPKTTETVGTYFREEDRRMVKLDDRIFGPPPEEKAEGVQARVAAGSRNVVGLDGFSLAGPAPSPP